MRFAVGLGKESAEERLKKNGISRRDFLKYCTAIAAAMGMGPCFAPEIAKAITESKRPVVVYLHNAECTGCSEALLRVTNPAYLDTLIFDTISLAYQETIMAAAGHQAEEALEEALQSPDGYICIIEGAVPTAGNGMYGKVGNHTMLSISKRVCENAKAIIAYGTCAAYGGIQAARPNPTESLGINDCFEKGFFKGKNRAINIPGCPPNPYNLVAAIVMYLQGKPIELDSLGRPNAFFGKSVHEQCERLPHFERSEFAMSFDSEEARKGWCLYQLGCKGPQTYNNCPTLLFNDTNWPVKAGHPCIGCSEPGFWDLMAPIYHG